MAERAEEYIEAGSAIEDGAEASEEQEQEQPSQAELIAAQKGWKPKDEFDGDDGSWVSAEEFLKREPLFDKIKNQSKQLKNLQRTIESLVNEQKSSIKSQVELRLKELKQQKREAIEMGDADKVDQIDEEIQAQKVETKQEQASVPAEVEEWISENDWFEKEKDMKTFALAFNSAYIQDNPGELEESLKATTKAVKKAFPDYFAKGQKSTDPPKTPSPVEGSTGTAKDTASKKGYHVSRLSSTQKDVYNQYVKVHKIMSHDEYFKGLEEIGELQ